MDLKAGPDFFLSSSSSRRGGQFGMAGGRIHIKNSIIVRPVNAFMHSASKVSLEARVENSQCFAASRT